MRGPQVIRHRYKAVTMEDYEYLWLLEGGKLENVYRVGDWISARILRIDEEDKKIGLTMRGVSQPTEEEAQVLEESAVTLEADSAAGEEE